MEIAISVTMVAKILLFLFISGFLTVTCLFPINDRPTTRGQVIFWLITEVLLFSWMFGFLNFTITA